MYMILVVLLGAMLVSWSIATTEPQQIVALNHAKSDALAGNFWAYRDMLVVYQNHHPETASGKAPPTDLAPPIGYQPLPIEPTDPQWSHYFDENRILYTFSLTPAANMPAGTIDAIANRHDRSLMVGIANNTGTAMTSIFTLLKNTYKQYDSNYPQFDPAENSQVNFPRLPAAAGIPANALVVVAN